MSNPVQAKKKRRGLKITGAIVGSFVLLAIVLGVVGGNSAPTPAATPATGLTSVCPEPKGAPTPPADGSAVAWDPYTCEWAKLPGTADKVSTVPTSVVEAPQYSPQVEQARDKAQSYLAFSGFSRTSLIGQLAFDQFPKDVATQAVDSLSVDWNAQGAKKAESYLGFTPFSCSGLISQLDSSAGDGFTKAQATYGAHQTAACK